MFSHTAGSGPRFRLPARFTRRARGLALVAGLCSVVLVAAVANAEEPSASPATTAPPGLSTTAPPGLSSPAASVAGPSLDEVGIADAACLRRGPAGPLPCADADS
jgi:hypothetical protein